jgi:hypothetical protein
MVKHSTTPGYVGALVTGHIEPRKVECPNLPKGEPCPVCGGAYVCLKWREKSNDAAGVAACPKFGSCKAVGDHGYDIPNVLCADFGCAGIAGVGAGDRKPKS